MEALQLPPEDDEAKREAELKAFEEMLKQHMENQQNTNLGIIGEVTDKRARRINDAKAYKQGVDVFRADPSVVLSPPQKTKTAPRKRVAPRTSPKRLRGNSRVFCRARPIFEHESERGEWECVSPLDQGLAVHEGIEKPRVGKGLVKVLRHHTYPSITRIDSDDEVYEQLRYLVEKTKSGSMATLFMYGMTGSGKTYSTSIFQSKAPFELCDAGLLPITTIGYELVGSRCFDLLNEEKNEVCSLEPSN